MITSKKNEKIKNIKKLMESARARQEQKLFVAEGARLVSEVPAQLIDSLYVSESFAKEILGNAAADRRSFENIPEGSADNENDGQGSHTERTWQTLKTLLNCLPYEVVADDVMRSVSDTVSPQGILAVVRQPDIRRDIGAAAEFKYEAGSMGAAVDPNVKAGADTNFAAAAADNEAGSAGAALYIILDDVRDPGNLGTVIRTAEAAGVREVALSPGCADVFSPKTVRATMGSLFRVRLVKTELVPYIEGLKKRGVRVLAACMEGKSMYDIDVHAKVSMGCGKMSFGGTDNDSTGKGGVICDDERHGRHGRGKHFPESTAIIIGNEANGVSRAVKAAADEMVSIPMEGQIESLNAAVSAAVLMYYFLGMMK